MTNLDNDITHTKYSNDLHLGYIRQTLLFIKKKEFLIQVLKSLIIFH